MYEGIYTRLNSSQAALPALLGAMIPNRLLTCQLVMLDAGNNYISV